MKNVLRLLCVLLLAATTLPGIASAQDVASQSLEAFVKAHIGNDHRIEVSFGELPKGTRLAPCHQIKPFIPYGTRLWGRTRIGVKCVAGADWTIQMPVTIKVFGKALVASRPLGANAQVSQADFSESEIELTRTTGQPILDPSGLDGQMTTRAMRAGDILMTYHLRVKPTVAAGDPVRVRVVGKGFVVSATGAALTAGSDGQALRVRTASGKVLMGKLNGQTVDIPL